MSQNTMRTMQRAVPSRSARAPKIHRTGRLLWRGRRAALGVLAVAIALVALVLPDLSSVAGAAVPTAPQSQLAVAGYDSAQFYWYVGGDGGTPINSFVIKTYMAGTTTLLGSQVVSAGAVGSALDPSPGALDMYTVTGLTGGVSVQFNVAAINADGTGPDSPEFSPAATPSATPVAPYAPTGVVSTRAATQIMLSWTVPPNNGSAISSFQIANDPGPGTISVPAGATGSSLDPTPGAEDHYTFTNLTVGQFTLSVTNGVGRSAGTLSSDAGVYAPNFSPSVSSFDFGNVTLGDYVGPQSITLTNVGSSAGVISSISFSGAGANDYSETDDCTGVIANSASCTVDVVFFPGALGQRPASLEVNDVSGTPAVVSLSGTGTVGYYQVDAEGDVFNYGDAGYYDDMGGTPLNKPIVGMAATGDNGGYWLVASDGGIFDFGDAGFHGSAGSIHLNRPIVGMAVTPDGGGYWMVASDGGIFSYGDAAFYGSTGSIALNKPIVGMAPTPDGGGYWLVASDGGIFSYGDARFYGSTGSIVLNKPIVGMAVTPDSGGYWMVASDGGIFAFGNAGFYGSTGAIHLAQPIVGMAATPDGKGYWFTAADGGLFNYGDAPFYGSTAGQGVTDMVAMASDAPPTVQASLDVPAMRHHLVK